LSKIVVFAQASRQAECFLLKVITHLHARLTPDFYPSFLPDLIAITTEAHNKAPTSSGSGNEKDREKDEKDRISRMRPVLRLIAELALIGAWEGYEGGKAMKGIKPEDVGPTLVMERVAHLVSALRTFLHLRSHQLIGGSFLLSDVRGPFVQQHSAANYFPQVI
jgi:hypothetical protein